MINEGVGARLDTLVSRVYGYPPSKLTLDGLSKLVIDFFQLFLTGVLFIVYPKQLSEDPTIVWAGAVALLLLMIYGFFPPMFRLLHGNYEHYVDEDEL